MNKIIKILIIFLFFLNTGCNTIKSKTDEIVEKENERLSEFIGQPLSELKIQMGKPDKEERSNKDLRVLIYKTKKYGIPCERKFELDNKEIVIGFVSKGCF